MSRRFLFINMVFAALPKHKTDKETIVLQFLFFNQMCILVHSVFCLVWLHLDRERECNAWMETTIIHQSLSSPAFLLSCQWLCQRYIIHTVWFIFDRHTVKCPCLCKKSWLAARGLMTGAYSSVGEEKPGTQLEYNPHPGGFKMDDSYTTNTSIQPSICVILPVLLSLYLPFLLMQFQQFLAFHLPLKILTHYPCFSGSSSPSPISLLLPFPLYLLPLFLPPLPPLFPIPPTTLLTWLAAWLHRFSPIKTEMYVHTHACHTWYKTSLIYISA